MIKVGTNQLRQTIGEKVICHLIGKNNQISFHETKDTAVNNQISIIVSHTLNEKV